MRPRSITQLAIAGIALVAPLFATGCQTSIGGQTLPSAWYLEDDVQYYPAGPEFKLPNLEERLDQYRLQQGAIAEDADPGF